jgi:fructose-1,6-bisphosphatase/inositol monophosphatase family enzyme
MSKFAVELSFAQRLVAPVGDIMRGGFRNNTTTDTKPDGTPVTEKDREVGRFVAHMLKRYRPGEPLLNEEDAEHAWGTGQGRCWVCDPIDGTWLYAGGVPTNIFSLALLERGRPVVGVAFDPYTASLFSAAIDTPAMLNGRLLRVNTVTKIPEACLALPGNKVPSLDAARLFGDVVNQGGDTVVYGSSVYDASLVALGFAAAAIYPYTSPWDIAAIKVIVEAAGGRVTDLRGHDQPYDRPIRGAIVSNGHIHDQVVRLVKKHLA